MKPLPPNSYFIRPFKAYKGFSYTYTCLGNNNPTLMTVEEGLAPTVGWVWPDSSEPINPDTGRSMRVVYSSIIGLFYPSSSIYWANQSSVTANDADISRRLPELDRNWSPGKTGDIYVISVSQLTYGERVRPGTVIITTGASSNRILDDGKGKLYSMTAPTEIIGNVFYELGLAAITKCSATSSVISSQGMNLTTGSTITVSYESQVSIYEHTAVCTLERDEFNYSNNPSLSVFVDGYPIGAATSSVYGISGSKMMDAFSSGTLAPYITTIGMYNSIGDLVALAKMPRAIRRTPDMDQTFIVRFDT